MQFMPSEDEVITLLRRTGALRDGHFEYSNGVHSNQHIETAIAMRSHTDAKVLSVALSRLLRRDPELRAILPGISIVSATAAGVPVAYTLAEVLHPKQVYWCENNGQSHQLFKPVPGEPVILVDDLLRSGQLVAKAKSALECGGARVLALAVLIYQPTPKTVDFNPLPLYFLAKLQTRAYSSGAACELCRQGSPFQHIGPDWKAEESVDDLCAAAG
jgi:orotate phosphoribosyltransferase